MPRELIVFGKTHHIFGKSVEMPLKMMMIYCTNTTA